MCKPFIFLEESKEITEEDVEKLKKLVGKVVATIRTPYKLKPIEETKIIPIEDITFEYLNKMKIEQSNADVYHYRVIFKPEAILPDIDLETSGK